MQRRQSRNSLAREAMERASPRVAPRATGPLWILGMLVLSTRIPGGTPSALWSQVAPVRIARATPARETPRAANADTPRDDADEYRGAADPLLDSSTEALLRRARSHIEAEEWNEVVDLFDQILASVLDAPGRRIEAARPSRAAEPDEGAPPGGLNRPEPPGADRPRTTFRLDEAVASSDGVLYEPIATAVRRQLLALPAEAQDLYTRIHQAAARELLQSARGVGGERGINALRRVASRYPLTEGGRTAWHLLGLRLLDAGRPAAAASALDARLKLPFGASDPARGEVLAQAAMAHLLAGAPRRARARLETLESEASEATILIRGEAVAGYEIAAHPFFQSLRRAIETGESSATGALWPTERGRFDNTAITLDPEHRPQLGSHARWIFPPGERTKSPPSSRTAEAFLPGIAACRGLVFVRGPRILGSDLVALEAESGRIEWRASPWELGPPRSGGQSYGSIGDLGLTVYRPPPDSDPDQDEALVLGIDRQSPAIRRSNNSYRFEPNRIAAYGTRTGKLVWITSDEDLRALGEETDLTFISAPVCLPSARRQAAVQLVAPAVNQESFFLVGLSGSGAPQWVRRLYDLDFSTPRGYLGAYTTLQMLAAADDLILAAPGDGVCAAVDAGTGDILWVSRYRSRIRSRRASRRWAYPAPVLTSRLAVVTPWDSDYVTAFDLETGTIVWERRFPHGSYHVLGAAGGSLYLCSDRLHALRLDDGADAWIGEPFEESLGHVHGDGFLATDSIYLPFDTGAIGVFSTADGEETDRIHLRDRRLSTGAYKRIFPVSGTLCAATSEGVFAIESQGDSWARLNRTQRQDLMKTALLLKGEARFAEALEVYYDLHDRYRSRRLRDEIEKEVLSTAREAATATGDPSFLTRLLERHAGMLSERATRLAFEMLQAKLLLDGGTPEGRRAAARTMLRLAELEGVVATSPDGLEVDVAAYAADVLRDLRLDGESFGVDQREADSRSERIQRELGENEEPSLTTLSGIVLRSSDLEVSAFALARLVARTEAQIGAAEAEELFDLLVADFPDVGRDEAVRERRAALSREARNAARRALRPELPGVLASGRPLEKRYWISAEEGFLAASVQGASPAPALFAVCGTHLRAYDEHGAVVFERELPEYPDVSEVKQYLQSQYEEPASVYFGDGRLVLFTPAGLFGFSYRRSLEASSRPADERAPGSQSGAQHAVGSGRSASEVKTLRLRWAQTYRHPLLVFRALQGVGFRGFQLPDAKNFFARSALLDADPIVLLPDGTLYQIRAGSGKLFWSTTVDGTPASGLELTGSRISVRTASPNGLRTIGLPRSAHAPVRGRLVEGPAGANHQARALLGGLVTVFAGQEFAVVESLTGHPLWRKKGFLGYVAYAENDQLWISEPGGRLRARAVRSGRIRRTIRLPEDSTVIECLEDPAGPGTPAAGRTLIALGSYGTSSAAIAPRGIANKVPVGQDLYVIRIDGTGEKIWESQVHAGAVVYGGSFFQAADGRFILAFNAEGVGDKWYTKLVRVDPHRSPAQGPESSPPNGTSPESTEKGADPTATASPENGPVNENREQNQEEGPGIHRPVGDHLERGTGRGPETGDADAFLTEIASVEISGKGNTLPPRLALLEDALGIGNTDGFGWLEPRDAKLEGGISQSEE